MTLSNEIDDLFAGMRRETPPKPEPVTYRLLPQDLDHEVPPEYHGAEVHPALRQAIQSRPGSIYLHGAPGTGKTRQAWALMRATRRRRIAGLIEHGEQVKHVPTNDWAWRPELTEDQWADGKLAQMRKDDIVQIITESGDIRRHRHDRDWLAEQAAFPRWLVVDDIGFAGADGWTLEAIYHLANERRAWRRPTLWTSNLTPDELGTTFSPAVASRLASGVVIRLDGEDRRLV